MLNRGADTTVINCTFVGNSTFYGGGMGNVAGCQFEFSPDGHTSTFRNLNIIEKDCPKGGLLSFGQTWVGSFQGDY